MTRDDFVSLPLRIALGLIYDMAEKRLRDIPRPDVPKPPLYDGRLSRDGGFVWMSEMDLGGLEWWAKTKQKSADGGGQYAEKDGKIAATLRKWLDWRALFPSDCWSGRRGDDRVTAAPPGRNPRVHEWGPRTDSTKKPDAKSGSGRSAAAPPDENEGNEDFGI